MLSRVLTTLALLGVAAGSASAADMRAMPQKAPLAAPPPVWNWTGLYGGVHVGAGWSTVESDLTEITVAGFPLFALIGGAVIPLSSHQLNGFLGGVQIGYDYQFAGPLVWGGEISASFTDIDGNAPCLLVFSCRTKTEWLVTATSRLGFAIDRALVYVKGGYAWAESEHSASLRIDGLLINVGPTSSDKSGPLVGAGVEYAFSPGWSAKVEYNYIRFDTETVVLPVTITGLVGLPIDATTQIRQDLHLVKFGLNYRLPIFGPGPAAPLGRY